MSRDDENKSLENILLHGNPNSERIGCPGREELISLALRLRAADDPLWLHVAECSSCYTDVRQLQQRHAVRAQEFARPTWVLLAAAAALVLAASTTWYWFSLQSSNAPPIVAKAVASKVLDLRPYAVSRSGAATNPGITLTLERTVQNVVLVLPVASSEGDYLLRFLDGNLEEKLSSRASAILRNGDTTIAKELDLSVMPAGRYTLALKRDPEDWRLFPVEVK